MILQQSFGIPRVGAITRIQNVSATANTVGISTPTTGDYIIVMSYFAGTATIPTLDANYTNIVATAGTSQAMRLAYRISTGGESSAGTWTNATQVVALVYRGVSALGTTPTINAGNGTTITYPAVTMQITSGSGWVTAFAGHSSVTAGMNGTPSGSAPNLGNRTNVTKANGCDTGAGISSNFTAQTLSITTTGRWQAVTIEIKA